MIDVPDIVPFKTALVNVLFVRVSVVALPTNVSVEVGSVKVPVLIIDAIVGVVRVLLVSVCVPVKVATVESIAKVTVLPLPLVSIPVPPVNVKVSESKSIFKAPPVSAIKSKS